jgi:hypothetical protein
MMFCHILGPRLDRKWLAEGAVDSFWKAHARLLPAVTRQKPRKLKKA